MDVSFADWAILLAIIAISFAVDFFLFQRDHETPPSFRAALLWSVFWIGIALAFAGYLLAIGERQAGEEYLTGYLLERSLSLDNVFVFSLIFASMAVPTVNRQDVLEIGIILALVLRAVFIVIGAELVDAVHWVLLVFGVFLIYTGIRMVWGGDHEDVDPDKNIGVRLLRRVMPVTDGFRAQRFIIRENGIRMATPLLAVVFAVATADVIFAVDSIPAIFGVTTDTYIVFAANAFALLGLRALFALLEGAQDRFAYLKYGLAAILVFIGAKMLVEEVTHVPIGISLGFIVLALAGSILYSLHRSAPATA
jgi:tellurite resistance protein TerC